MAISAQQLAANKRFEFVSRAFGEDKFAVVKMSGFEAISKPFRFTLTLVSDDPDIDFDKVLQNPAELRIFAPGGASSTPYHGMIAAFEQLHKSDGYVFYQAVLVPRLWQLSLYQVSEVYLEDDDIPGVAKKVLEQSRLTSGDFEFKLSGEYRKRSYVCQYQETHLDFLSRWMEKEGMYFYFDHDGKSDKLVIADNRSMHAASAVKVLYRPINEQDTGTSGDSIQDFVCRQEPLPKQVVLRDFNHRKAHIELKATAPVSENGMGEINIYGENFRDEEEGKRYARLRAEEILCGARVFSGEGMAVGLRSGHFMELDRHYRGTFNGKYLVTEVQHEGSQAAALLTGTQGIQGEGGEAQGETSYRTSFRAIPAATQFRPKRSTVKPKVIGTMNAIIDAAGIGEYAELDAFGQYKVQLPFDNSDKSAGKGSARVRMASPYAGSDHGMNFPLQKNAEVLLSFVDGDPDQPVILGAVPNSENPSVVNHNNPHENRISTKGGNQLFMSDSKGKEKTWLHSPVGNSSIGIGNTHDGAGNEDAGHDGGGGHDDDKKHKGGGLSFITGGAKEEITIGNKYELSVGTAAEIKLGVETQLEAGFKNTIGLEGKFAFSRDDEVKWVTGTQYVVEDEESFNISHHNHSTAAGGVTLKGGHADHHVQHALYVKMKAVALAAIFTVVGANVATSAVIMSKLLKSKDQKKSEHEHKHGQVEQEKEQSFEIPLDPIAIWHASEPAALSALGAVVNTTTSVAALMGAKAVLKRLAAQYEALSYVSEVDLSDQGLRQTVRTGGVFTELTQLATGFKIRTLPAADAAAAVPVVDNPAESVISANAGDALVKAGTSIQLVAPDVNLGVDANGTTGLGMRQDLTWLMSGASSVTVQPAEVNIVSTKVALGFSRAPRVPPVPDPVYVARRPVVDLAYRAARTAYHAALALPIVPGAMARRRELFAIMVARRTELETINASIAAAARPGNPAGPLQHGFEVDNTKAVMAFGTAGVKASDTGLSIKMGTNTVADFRPVGLSLDGTTIQLG